MTRDEKLKSTSYHRILCHSSCGNDKTERQGEEQSEEKDSGTHPQTFRELFYHRQYIPDIRRRDQCVTDKTHLPMIRQSLPSKYFSEIFFAVPSATISFRVFST